MMNGGFKAVAATDGRDFEVKRRVLGMAAFFQEVFLGLLRSSDLGQDRLGVSLPEMVAKSALSVFDV